MEPEPGVLAGQDTLVACWKALAATSPGATVVESVNAVIATFPAFAPINNAIMLRWTDTVLREERARMASTYAHAGVESWALWIPHRANSFDAADAVTVVGDLTRDTTTLVMEATIGKKRRSHAAARPASITAAIHASAEATPSDELGEPDPDGKLAGYVMLDG